MLGLGCGLDSRVYRIDPPPTVRWYDRPTLVVAEGLMMYVPKDDVRRLVGTVTERFPSGQLAFDVMVPWTARFSALFGLRLWGTDDPHEIEGWGRGVTLLEDAPAIADHARIPAPLYRVNYRLFDAFAATRNIVRPLLYRFGG